VITRLYFFQHQRRAEVGSLYENPLLPKALSKDIFRFISEIHEEYGHIYGDVVMCADCDGPSWRSDLFPEYKASRKKNKNEDVRDMKRFVKNFINEFWMNYRNGPTYVYKMDKIEADDIIGLLVLSNPQERHMIVSRDKDFFQLHSDMVVSYDYQKTKIIRHDGKKSLQEHIICGDAGDGIPNIMSDLDTFVREEKRQRPMTKSRLSKFMREVPDEHRGRYEQNKMLISFYDIPDQIKTNIMENIKC
jgi:serine/threonine protein kinase